MNTKSKSSGTEKPATKVNPYELLAKYTEAMTQIAEDAKAISTDIQTILKTNQEKKNRFY